MTTITDKGLKLIGNSLIGNSSGLIDALAVGTGTGSETNSATSLGNEIFRGDVSNNNVETVETGQTGESELIIRVKGGLEVPAGTAVTEVGCFANGVGGGGTLIFIDNFAKVIIETGHTEEFTLPVDPRRGT